MSASVGKSDLQLMDEFDCKAPINASVILYDSDEDANPSIENGQNSNVITKNGDAIEREDICKEANETNHENKVTSRKRRSSKETKANKKIKGAGNVTRCRNTEYVYQNQTNILNRSIAASNDETVFREDQCTLYNNHQVLINTLKGSLENHPLVCTRPIAFPQSEADINMKANECIRTLLDTVSTHMIFIMKAYADYILLTRRTSDRATLEKARKCFMDTKSHFFYLSFSAACNIMLPKENDPFFMDNFIDKTVKLANARHFYLKHCDVKSLCGDMLVWVKSHMQELNKPSSPSTFPTSLNSCRRQQDCDKSNDALHQTCIFREGPPGRELTINRVSNVNQNSQNTIQQFHNANPGIPVQNMPIPRQSEQAPRDEFRSYSISTRYMHEFEAFNARNDYNNQHPFDQPISNKRQTNNVQIQHNLTALQEMSSRLPPSYQQTQTWKNQQSYSEKQFINSANYDSFVTDQGQLEVNRSLSRDSGFMSPMSSASSDPMCTSPRNEQIDSSSSLVTPLITHVTSLNPSVAFIKDGMCHVCGKLTKQMCFGCYKYYYCSYQCQSHDWKNHVSICK